MDPKRTRSISRRIRFVFYQSKCEVTIRLVVFEKKNVCFFAQSFSPCSAWLLRPVQLVPSLITAPELLWPTQTVKNALCFQTASSKSTSVSPFPVRLWKGWKFTAWVLLPSCAAGNKKRKSASGFLSNKVAQPFSSKEKMPSQGAIQDICLLDGT